jgi:hypothetical protein
VRIRAGDPDGRSHLLRAFSSLFRLYGRRAHFYVTVSCNAVLSNLAGNSFSMWFGHDFTEQRLHDLYVGGVQHVNSLSDAAKLSTDYTVEDFQRSFSMMFENSEARVIALACVVYKITRVIKDYERDKTVGQRFMRLF